VVVGPCGYYQETTFYLQTIDLYFLDNFFLIKQNYRPISICIQSYLNKLHIPSSNLFSEQNILYSRAYGCSWIAWQNCECKILKKLGHVFLYISSESFRHCQIVNHNILIENRRYCGIEEIILDLFKNYLKGRMQFVSFNGAVSHFWLFHFVYGTPRFYIKLNPDLIIINIDDLHVRYRSKLLYFVLVCWWH